MPYWTNVLTETSISYVCGGRCRGASERDNHCAAGELNAEGFEPQTEQIEKVQHGETHS